MCTDKKKYSDIKKYCDAFFPLDDFDKAFIKMSLKIFFPECLNNNIIKI